MKNTAKIIILSLQIIVASTSMAGTPDQDPMVRELQSRYIKGTFPYLGAFENQTFTCLERSVAPDQYETSELVMSCRGFDGFMAVCTDKSFHQRIFAQPNSVNYMGSVEGNTTDGVETLHFRTEGNRVLLGERTHTRPRIPTGVRSTDMYFNTEAQVTGYLVCIYTTP